MLRIYTARANVDSDRFLFGRVADALASGRRVFLIVPEQSTLKAEADAFDYLDVAGFIDFDVLSMTSLGRRILAETGYGSAEAPAFISKYGKFMLLSRLLYRRRDDMKTFRHLESSPDFVEKLNDMIAELKNHNVTPADLTDIASEMKTESLLKRKLEDAALVYAGYEEQISGRYIDQTDHLKLYTSKMGQASFIPDAEFWLTGFDYLSPAVMDAVVELSKHAASVSLVLTADAGAPKSDPLFSLTNGLAAELSRRSADAGVESAIEPIPKDAASGYLADLPPEIAHIESALFTRPHTPYAGGRTGALRLIVAANFYAEAETAAAEIAQLIRDGLELPGGGRGELRYRDVLVLCNDMKERGPIIRRVFARYGLPVFMDQRRNVEHNPVVEYILALPRIAARGRRHDDVFTLLKTGLTDIAQDEIEELENYALRYNVRGRRWDRPFDDDSLNGSRERVSALLAAFEKGFKAGRTAAERTDALLSFLTEDASFAEMIEGYARRLEEAGRLDYAAEMAGMWDVVTEILGQMGAVLGDLPMSQEEYAVVLRAGFDSVRMGVLPSASDQIVLGTMQRTRSGGARAVYVLGANDGVLPAGAAGGAILSEDEVYRLADAGHVVARTEDLTHLEEELAIYRNLSKPRALLRVSYAAADSAGEGLAPSPVFVRLQRLFPDVPEEKDVWNAPKDSAPAVVQATDEALDHLAERLRAYINGEVLPDVWKDVMAWYRRHRPAELARVKAGLTFRGRRARVDARFVDSLYGRRTSPSAIERYSRCPFSWFMTYGIGLKERRVYGTDSRDLGDIYHGVLMRFGQEMCADGKRPSDEGSRWQTVTDGEIAALASRLTSAEFARVADSADGVGTADPEAALNDYRCGRVARTVTEAARALTRQVREGRLDGMFFESAFGARGEFPAMEFSGDLGAETGAVRIEGRIDRVDVLDGGYARIVDYKSGAEKFSAEDAADGYQLQLMIYLQAVSARLKPAGVFYFRIREPRIEDGADGSDLAEKVLSSMELDGMAINDARALTAMGIDPDGRKKKGRVDAEEFDALRASVTALLKELIADLSEGRVDAAPKTAVKLKTPGDRNRKACDYCRYKGICNYDPTL
jgi:ATP-dependent helicase/nuclease subunit B